MITIHGNEIRLDGITVAVVLDPGTLLSYTEKFLSILKASNNTQREMERDDLLAELRDLLLKLDERLDGKLLQR